MRKLIIILMMIWLTISVYQNHLKKKPTPIYIHEYIEEETKCPTELNDGAR